jgi:hypothetical protein
MADDAEWLRHAIAADRIKIAQLESEIARLRLTGEERRDMNTDNTQDANEPSLASAGSKPVAWAVTAGPPGDLSVYEAFADHQKDEAMSLARECLFGETNRPLPLAPLYFAPALTDEEREVIFRAMYRVAGADSAILWSLLERLK